MPKIRTLVPLVHPKTGENFGVGTEVDVDDELFREWRADGKVADVEAEQAQAKQEGNYTARTGRDDTTSTKASKKDKG